MTSFGYDKHTRIFCNLLLSHCGTLQPYNPAANGFIERYFRTLRKDLFRKLKANHLVVSQASLDDFPFIKNHCSSVGKTGKTPVELAGRLNDIEIPNHFELEKVKIQS